MLCSQIDVGGIVPQGSHETNAEKFSIAVNEKLNSLTDEELARAILLFTEIMDSAIIKPRPLVNRGVGTNQ